MKYLYILILILFLLFVYGCSTYTCHDTYIGEISTYAPQEYNISQNVPNPVDSTTSFEVSLRSDAIITLKLQDINGNDLCILLKGAMLAGKYKINFKLHDIKMGAYKYHIYAVGMDRYIFQNTKTLIYNK